MKREKRVYSKRAENGEPGNIFFPRSSCGSCRHALCSCSSVGKSSGGVLFINTKLGTRARANGWVKARNEQAARTRCLDVWHTCCWTSERCACVQWCRLLRWTSMRNSLASTTRTDTNNTIVFFFFGKY